MSRQKYAEEMRYQCLLTLAHNIPVEEKIHHVWNLYLCHVDPLDVPGVIRGGYNELRTVIDELFCSAGKGITQKVYFQLFIQLTDLHREIVRWNALENYITISRQEMMHG